MREADAILVADMCHNESAITEDVRYITYYAKNLPDDAGITVHDSGITFKASPRCLSFTAGYRQAGDDGNPAESAGFPRGWKL